MDERFQEVSNEWMNTGGHCMVDITTVYDKQDKKLLYMLVGNDWMTLTTYNYVSNEVPYDSSAEDYVVYTIEMNDFSTEPAPGNWAMINLPNEYFDLFNHGLLSYIRNKFKYDRQLTHTTLDQLPVELGRRCDVKYAAWCNENDLLITTDGDKILYNDRYIAEQLDSNGVEATKFKQLLLKMRSDADIDDDHLAVFEDEKIHLIINGKAFTLEMCAAVWNGLIEYADYIISEQ